MNVYPTFSFARRREDLSALGGNVHVGGDGDTTDPESLFNYAGAFAAIEVSPDQTLYVAECGGEVIGTVQTVVMTTLTGRVSSAMIIEAV